MKELEQELGLQAGAVRVEGVQMQKDVLRIARHLLADVSAPSASVVQAAHLAADAPDVRAVDDSAPRQSPALQDAQ